MTALEEGLIQHDVLRPRMHRAARASPAAALVGRHVRHTRSGDGIEGTDIMTSCESERTEAAEQRGRHFIGQIDAVRRVPRFEASLVRQGSSVPSAEWIVDEHGLRGFEADPGRYDLFIRLGDNLVVVPNIEIQ